MVDRSTTGWPGFLHWGRKFFELPNFDADEREYKFRAVRPLQVARRNLLSGRDWVGDLAQGFRNSDNNIVSHFQFLPFMDWVSDDQEAATEAMRRLWMQADLDGPARVDVFSQRLPRYVLGGPGLRCNLAAYLLGAIDPIEWPNYKATANRLAYELARYPRQPSLASIGEIYAHALRFYDRLLEEAAATNLMLRDRLDAQGVMWCVAHWRNKPKSFSADEWRELLEFRAIRPDAPRPKRTRPSQRSAPRRPVCPLCASDEELLLVGPTDDGWLYICETGPGHEEPYEFSIRSS